MASVKFGGGIIQMSGSIAGNTFARNRYGNYVRARTKPVNPNTALQQGVRAAVAFLADRWAQTVTAVQRTAWNDYADAVNMKNKLGETIHLSGFNHYIRSNSIRKSCNKTIIDAGPVVFELPAQDPVFDCTMSEATQVISVIFDDTMDWSTEDGAWMMVFMGKPQNPQRNFFAGPWRYCDSVQGIDPGGAASPNPVAATYFGSETQKVWFYARISRADGRLSEVFRADTFCAA